MDKLLNAPKLKSLGAALFGGGKKNNYKNPKDFTPLENNASQAEYFESNSICWLYLSLGQAQYMLTDLKKTLLEMRIQG